MTTASLPKPLAFVDHAESVATFLVRNFPSLLWSGWMLVSSCWTRHRALELGLGATIAWLPIVFFAVCFSLPIAMAARPVAKKYRPTEPDEVIRWCRVDPLGAPRGALWIGGDALRIVGPGYDEHVPYAQITRVEARVRGPSSFRARFFGQTQPVVLTKPDGTEVSLIVAAPTSIARSLRHAAGLA